MTRPASTEDVEQFDYDDAGRATAQTITHAARTRATLAYDYNVTAAAMIDRLVHQAEIIALKGDSCRLKDRDLARPPAAKTPQTA